MPIKFMAMATQAARAFQRGAADAYDMMPDMAVSDGEGVPCRHCLRTVAKGQTYLILAYRPFPALQPYAETGPIFLCAEECERAPETDRTPDIFAGTPDYIVRGYGHDDRIVYGTGSVTPTAQIPARAEALFKRDDVAYLHVRSARNNCYQLRLERA